MALKERRASRLAEERTYSRSKQLDKPAVSGQGDLNIKKLRQLVAYLSHLHSQGEISDKALESLVCLAYSLYVEAEVNSKIQGLEAKIRQILEI